MYTVYDIYDVPLGYFDNLIRAEDFAQYLATIGEETYIQDEPRRYVIETDETGKVV